jgi:hypothetical protein
MVDGSFFILKDNENIFLNITILQKKRTKAISTIDMQ